MNHTQTGVFGDSLVVEEAIGSPTETTAPIQWKMGMRNVYRCKVILSREAGGRYSVYAANLPGVSSQGESEEDALSNIKEALEGAIELYGEGGGSIPWDTAEPELEDGDLTRIVMVHA